MKTVLLSTFFHKKVPHRSVCVCALELLVRYIELFYLTQQANFQAAPEEKIKRVCWGV